MQRARGERSMTGVPPEAVEGWTGPGSDPRSYYVSDRRQFLSGGFGVVYRATVDTDRLNVERGSLAAVKLFTDISPERFAKLQERCKSLRYVLHPNLAQVFEAFEGPPFSADGVGDEDVIERYCAHAWIKGETLAERCRSATTEEILGWGSDAAAGLDHLHTHPRGPFAHRDIHPRNMIVTPLGVAVLIDFDMVLVEGTGGAVTKTLLPGSRFAPIDRRPGLLGAQADDRQSLARTLLYCLASDPDATLDLDAASEAATGRTERGEPGAERAVMVLRSVIEGRDTRSAAALIEQCRGQGGVGTRYLRRQQVRRARSHEDMTTGTPWRGRRRAVHGIHSLPTVVLMMAVVVLAVAGTLVGVSLTSNNAQSAELPTRAFPAVQLSNGLLVEQKWSLGGVDYSSLLATLEITNDSGAKVDSTYVEHIPTQVTQEIEPSNFQPSATILSQDPAFEYTIRLRPGATAAYSFQVFVGPSNQRPLRRLQRFMSLELGLLSTNQSLTLVHIAASHHTITVDDGSWFPVALTGTLSNGARASDGLLAEDVQWKSTNTRILSITAGVLHALGHGMAVVVATFGDQSLRIRVTVLPQTTVSSTVPKGPIRGGGTTTTTSTAPTTSTTRNPTTTTTRPQRGSTTSSTSTVTTTTQPQTITYAETTGGVTHTWSDSQTAGGNEGPSIGAYVTVQITCRLVGFKVADGNTWWYKIASSPWNNAYYASADAFYNDGQTSGTLQGTPFVDPNVPLC